MNKLKYVPVFRIRQQEISVLSSFDFGDRIYPCLEIFKERDRVQPKPKKNAKKPAEAKPDKTFEQAYFPLIKRINAERIFVDLPVHFREKKGMNPAGLLFMRSVVANRKKRTEYVKKLKPFGPKIIPVISSYFPRTGEKNSIILQETDLRPDFKDLAFRTFPETFDRDIIQISQRVKPDDFLFVDFDEEELNDADERHQEIIEQVADLKCIVIIHRSSVLREATNKEIEHNQPVAAFVNDQLEKYKSFEGDCFSDYAGIKKDDIQEGGTISPGFYYYDAVENEYVGFRGIVKQLNSFETIIVPDVVKSAATKRMKDMNPDLLNDDNPGWQKIMRIHRNQDSGKNAAIFKSIAMGHYLHCIKTEIENGDFDD